MLLFLKHPLTHMMKNQLHLIELERDQLEPKFLSFRQCSKNKFLSSFSLLRYSSAASASCGLCAFFLASLKYPSSCSRCFIDRLATPSNSSTRLFDMINTTLDISPLRFIFDITQFGPPFKICRSFYCTIQNILMF